MALTEKALRLIAGKQVTLFPGVYLSRNYKLALLARVGEQAHFVTSMTGKLELRHWDKERFAAEFVFSMSAQLKDIAQSYRESEIERSDEALKVLNYLIER